MFLRTTRWRERSRRSAPRVIEFGEKRWCTSGSSTKALGHGGRGAARSPSPRAAWCPGRSGRGRGRGRGGRRGSRVLIMFRRSSISRMWPSTGVQRRGRGRARDASARRGRSSRPPSLPQAGVGADVAGGGEARHLLLELARQPFVVAVLEGDPGAARLGDPVFRAVAAPCSEGLPTSRTRETRHFGGRREGAVGRAVVDDDELEVGPGLPQHASRSRRGSSPPG